MLLQTTTQTSSSPGLLPCDFLALAALILGLANGLILFWRYVTDRPILRVKPVHPDVYQWFFRLPAGKYQGTETRKYGILIYIDVINRGRRSVQLESWNLRVPSMARRWSTLKPLSIPEPHTQLGDAGEKVWPVLGVRGPMTSGSTLVPSGESIGGFAYYVAEWWGSAQHDLRIVDGKASVVAEIRSILGNQARTTVVLTEISLEKAEEMVQGIETVDRTLTLRSVGLE